MFQQSRAAGSSLQLLSPLGGNRGYQVALSKKRSMTGSALRRKARANMPREHSLVLGTDRRGTAPIKDCFLKALRRRLAGQGGRRFAGAGSSSIDVQRKASLMIGAYEETERFPSRRQAAKHWNVGCSLWSRIRRLCLR